MCQADRCDFFSLCLMNFSFTAETDSLKLLMEKPHCSDFDGNMNVWVLEGSDFCAKNYRDSVVQAWGEDGAGAMQDWCLTQGMQYKRVEFSSVMIRCFFTMIPGKQKGSSEASS